MHWRRYILLRFYSISFSFLFTSSLVSSKNNPARAFREVVNAYLSLPQGFRLGSPQHINCPYKTGALDHLSDHRVWVWEEWLMWAQTYTYYPVHTWCAWVFTDTLSVFSVIHCEEYLVATKHIHCSVADPGFPRQGTLTYYLGKKLNKIGSKGGARS